MSNPAVHETAYYGYGATLYPVDVRYDPADRAFCNPRADGRVQFRLHTEPGFGEGVLVYNDGTVQAEPLQLVAQDGRFLYWEVTIRPQQAQVRYSFALKREDGRALYIGRAGVTNAIESPFVLDLAQAGLLETPEWVRGAIIYQIFPERFANGDAGNDPAGTAPWANEPEGFTFQGGDLPGITAKLDYLQELGVQVLYLNPINTSPSTHKYNASDFLHVDPAFGGDEALRELVAAAHERQMRIILDASFNHCDPTFFAFRDLMEHGPESRYREWFTVHDYPVRIRYRPGQFHNHPYFRPERIMPHLERVAAQTGLALEEVHDEGPPIEPTYEAWFNVLTMPQLNQRNPETRAYFLNVAAYWLREFDIDGWRMDVVQHVVSDFWPEFRRVCKSVKPDCYLLAEVWGNTSLWLQDGFDATMNYTFTSLCIDYFARTELSTKAFVDGLTRMTMMYAPQVTAVNQNLLSSHDVPRFLHEAGERRERLALATLLQLTMPGAPGIYYGDEIGMSGGRDPDCRRTFPWDRPETWDRSQLEMTQALIWLRRKSAALRYGSWRPVWCGEETLAFLREHGQERVLVALNRQGSEAASFTVEVGDARPERLWGEARVTAGEGGVRIEGLTPWSGVVVQL